MEDRCGRPSRVVFAMNPAHLPALFPAGLIRRLSVLARLDPALCVEDFADERYAADLGSRGRERRVEVGGPPIAGVDGWAEAT